MFYRFVKHIFCISLYFFYMNSFIAIFTIIYARKQIAIQIRDFIKAEVAALVSLLSQRAVISLNQFITINRKHTNPIANRR